MAYESGCSKAPRVNVFSNPDVEYAGKPQGTESTNNARAIRESMVRRIRRGRARGESLGWRSGGSAGGGSRAMRASSVSRVGGTRSWDDWPHLVPGPLTRCHLRASIPPSRLWTAGVNRVKTPPKCTKHGWAQNVSGTAACGSKEGTDHRRSPKGSPSVEFIRRVLAVSHLILTPVFELAFGSRMPDPAAMAPSGLETGLRGDQARSGHPLSPP